MKAEVGDRVVVESPHTGEKRRDGEIIALHDPLGGPPYDVRWSDNGHVSVFSPGPDAHVVRLHAGQEPAAATSPGKRTVEWTVKLVFEEGQDTTQAHLRVDTGSSVMESIGKARRMVHDEPSATIGEEVAAGRALVHLGDDLLRRAAVESAQDRPTRGA